MNPRMLTLTRKIQWVIECTFSCRQGLVNPRLLQIGHSGNGGKGMESRASEWADWKHLLKLESQGLS
jgi:hypothetical protein